MEHIGISGISTYIPEKRYNTCKLIESGYIQEIVFNKIGVTEVPVGQLEDTPTEMAIRAAIKLMDQLDVESDDIDIIVYVGATPPDYLLWSPAAKVADALNIKNAFCFEMQLGCGGVQAAIQAIKAMMLGGNQWNKALIVAADMWDAYTKERSGAGLIFGDSAAATLLEKGKDVSHRLVSFNGFTDGQFHSLGHLTDGTAYTKNLSNQYPNLPDGQYSIINKSKIPALNKLNIKNYKKVTENVLIDSGWELRDIKYLILPSGRIDLMKKIASEFSFLHESTNIPFLSKQGDLGAPGLLVDLDNLARTHSLQKGDKILALSAGVGITWMALTIQV